MRLACWRARLAIANFSGRVNAMQISRSFEKIVSARRRNQHARRMRYPERRVERGASDAVTNRILDEFVKACAPREAIVTAQFSARGGIALTVRAEYPDRKSGRDNE